MRGHVGRELGEPSLTRVRTERPDTRPFSARPEGQREEQRRQLTWAAFCGQAVHRVQRVLQSAGCTAEFLEVAKHLLTPQLYDNAVMERQALLWCGWPLCQKRIQPWAPNKAVPDRHDTPQPTFHASPDALCLYDTTVLSGFCCADCVERSAAWRGALDGEAVEHRSSAPQALLSLFPQLGKEDIVRLRGSFPAPGRTDVRLAQQSLPLGVVIASEQPTLPPRAAAAQPDRRPAPAPAAAGPAGAAPPGGDPAAKPPAAPAPAAAAAAPPEAAAAPARKRPTRGAAPQTAPSHVRALHQLHELRGAAPSSPSHAAPRAPAAEAALWAERERAAAACAAQQPPAPAGGPAEQRRGGARGAEGELSESGSESSSGESESSSDSGEGAVWHQPCGGGREMGRAQSDDEEDGPLGGGRDLYARCGLGAQLQELFGNCATAATRAWRGPATDPCPAPAGPGAHYGEGAEEGPEEPPVHPDEADAVERHAVLLDRLTEGAGAVVAAMRRALARSGEPLPTEEDGGDPLATVRPLLRTLTPQRFVPALSHRTAAAALLLLWQHAALYRPQPLRAEAAAAASILAGLGLDREQCAHIRELLGRPPPAPRRS
eukprot:TRINITY_DN70387_c0_g1_i1.p1 TRINITY_DN70387_c0_g1~~TRINITY_DN70387_c0_g1_i1.p1  ORF type:complete len:632 (+),score=161.09 TRINITY_DN70387_c0_g1_i1:88-1896(+)